MVRRGEQDVRTTTLVSPLVRLGGLRRRPSSAASCRGARLVAAQPVVLNQLLWAEACVREACDLNKYSAILECCSRAVGACSKHNMVAARYG